MVQEMKEIRLPHKNLNDIRTLKIKWETIEIMDIRHNFLVNFEFWPQSVPNLLFCFLSHNEIANLDNFPQLLPNLIHLDLNHNKLQSLATFPVDLPALQILDLRNNRIESFKGLPSSVTHIKTLALRGNPIKTFKDLPYSLIAGLIPHLSMEIINSFELPADELKIITHLLKHPQNGKIWAQLEQFFLCD